MSHWQLYMLDVDGRLYTGITTDPARRLKEHRGGGRRAARFTRGAGHIRMAFCIRIGDRGTALRAEHRLRRLRRDEKLALIRQRPSRARLLKRLGLDQTAP